jgi:hypothetical protein
VIPPDATPPEYLPPTGVAPGTTLSLGQLYRFDRTRYQLYPPYPGTPERYIKRDSILAPRGQSVDPQGRLRDPALRFPDLVDPSLRPIYDDPRLFGFIAGDAGQGAFESGPVVDGSQSFFPLHLNDRWVYNHNSNDWTRTDQVVEFTTASTSGGLSNVAVVRSTNEAGFGRDAYYKPPVYASTNLVGPEVPGLGTGLFFHGWSLIAERAVALADRGCATCEPIWQRNPRPLWISSGSFFLPVDICIDGLPAELRFAALQIAGDPVRIGELYTTWTYIEVDTEQLRQRVEARRETGECGTEIVTGRDTLRTFPTGTFSLLARFESRAERAYDYLELRNSLGNLIGSYGERDAAGRPDVIKFTVKMFTTGYGGESPALLAQIFYARGIGEVVRFTGSNLDTRSTTRLRQATIDGVDYPPEFFQYQN